MTTIFFAMLRREVQEHKVAFIYAPFIVTIVLCFVIASVYFGITDIQTAEFNFSTEIYDEDYQEGMLQAVSRNAYNLSVSGTSYQSRWRGVSDPGRLTGSGR